MAPRRRPLKKGESRMDAALDAMTPFGFDKKLVYQTVNKLLKVYDSNEGWGFIEYGAYQLLIDQILEAQKEDQEEQHMKHLSLVNEFDPEMRREEDSMSNYTCRITRSSKKFNSFSVGSSSSSREKEVKEDGPLNYTDGFVDKDPSCLTVNTKVRKNPEEEGSQGMSPLALSEPVIDNGLHKHTDNRVTNFNVAPTDEVTRFSTDFNNFKSSIEGFTNDVENSCSQHKRKKIEKLVDSMGQRPASGTSSIKEDNLEAVIGVQRSAFDQANDTRQADAMVDTSESQEMEGGPSCKVRKQEVSRSGKKKAASNNYSTTYTVDELMQNSKSMNKYSYSPLNWDSRTTQFVDTLVDAIKKHQAHARALKKQEDMENARS